MSLGEGYDGESEHPSENEKARMADATFSASCRGRVPLDCLTSSANMYRESSKGVCCVLDSHLLDVGFSVRAHIRVSGVLSRFHSFSIRNLSARISVLEGLLKSSHSFQSNPVAIAVTLVTIRNFFRGQIFIVAE